MFVALRFMLDLIQDDQHVPRTEPGFWRETFRDVDWTQQKANDFRFTLEFKDLT